MTLESLRPALPPLSPPSAARGRARRLLDMGLIPRTEVTLQKIAPMGDPIQIRVRGYELTLRIEDAKKIEVREVGSK